MTTEQCKFHELKITERATDVKEVKTLLLGNGKIGVAEMARRSYEYVTQAKETKNGLLDWVFRAVITVAVGYIAVQVGI